MDHQKNKALIFTFLVLWVFVISCNDSGNSGQKKLISNPEKMNKQASKELKEVLEFAIQHNGKIDDSIQLRFGKIVYDFYKNNEDTIIWSYKEKWEPLADSLYQFVQHAELYGLFSDDYHFKNLTSLKNKLDTDSLARMNASLWSKADLMLTDGFMHIVKDLKAGRAFPDSALLHKDSTLTNSFFVAVLKQLLEKKELASVLTTIEPAHAGYWELKKGIQRFVDSMDRRIYTYVTYPYKANDEKDSIAFIKTFQKRLNESGYINFTNKLPDSTQLNEAVKKYQQKKGLKQDGIISSSLVKQLNTSDVERFNRIAITLDRYKQLPAKMPEEYIWVNLPGYYLQVWDHDTIVLESKVICGKPSTRTPLLNSYITDMITYPTWTVPTSIIAKQYLPKLKNNPNYLSRLGLRLVNSKGETVDPGNVNWSKYSKGIPFKVVQGSGDNNALGVIKFNFDNPYAVYLHDTNQRYLFKNSARALSHGCVRVQEWEKLAFYLVRNDSLNLKPGDTLRYSTDSIKHLIANKERKRLEVKNKVALFISYFGCEGKDGKIKFYDDIYGEDKMLREQYFSAK